MEHRKSPGLFSPRVMAGLVPAIHDFVSDIKEDVDANSSRMFPTWVIRKPPKSGTPDFGDKRGHDGWRAPWT
jgi:hypothetical protein